MSSYSSNDFLSIRSSTSNQETITSSLNVLVDNNYFAEALDYLSSFKATLSPEVLLAKAKAYYGLRKYPQVLSIVSMAEYIDWDTYDFYFLKGKALFSLEEYEAANEAFEKSHRMHPTNESQEALFRCQIKLYHEQNPRENVTITRPF